MSLEGLFTHASIITRAVGADLAARIRAPLTFERYALLDRGSYEHAAYREPDVLKIVCELAGKHLGRALTPVGARVIRLRAGDFLLAHHDEEHARLVSHAAASTPISSASSASTSTHFELVLDLSPVAAPAEIHYRRRGQVFFRMPCVPGSLAIVERTSAITCNHTYVSRLARDADVVRLIVQTLG